MSVVELAERLGSHPLGMLALLVCVALVSLATVLLILRWSTQHARSAWRWALARWRVLAARPFMRRLEARYPSVWRTMRTLTETEYLLIHLAIGFGAALATIAFMAIAFAVFQGRTATSVDLAIAGALHTSADPTTISFFRVFTYLGSEGVVATGILVTAILLIRKQRLLAIGWALSLIGGAILNGALKGAFSRPRPSFVDPITVSTGWSFPSGHAMSTWIATGMLVYVFALFVPDLRRRVGVLAVALVWCIAMGFSRMVLGVHYLTDVLGGFAAGTVWLGACVSGLEIARRRPRSAPIV